MQPEVVQQPPKLALGVTISAENRSVSRMKSSFPVPRCVFLLDEHFSFQMIDDRARLTWQLWRSGRAFAIICSVVFALEARQSPAFILNPGDPDPWLTTASGTRVGNGAAATITWSIVPDGTLLTRDTGVGTSSSNLISFMNSRFGGNSSQTNLTLQPWFHLLTDSFNRWSQLSGVTYVYESHDDKVLLPSSNGQLSVRGDIRIGGYNVDGADGTLAFTYLPTGGSDMVIDTGDGSFFSSSTTNYINFRNTVMHELGHSFGMEHVDSTTSNLLMEPVIDTSFDGPQLDEVRGVQYFFGDANEKTNGGTGNNTAAHATSLGTILNGGTKAVGSAANVPTQAISAAATDFVSISNVNDIDFYSFSIASPSLLSAMLTPRGGVFTQGAADFGETPTSFNANARNNLAISIFSTDGSTLLGSADVNAAGITESITNLVLPAAGTYFARVAGADDTIQLYELSLAVTAAGLPGDYNHDGVVDAADYAIWRHSEGQAVTIGTGADGNLDGQITSADFDIWRSHFGQTAGVGADLSVATVPEPAATVLMLLGIAAMWPPTSSERRRQWS